MIQYGKIYSDTTYIFTHEGQLINIVMFWCVLAVYYLVTIYYLAISHDFNYFRPRHKQQDYSKTRTEAQL